MNNLIDLEKKIAQIEEEINEIKSKLPEDKFTMVIMSGDLDKLMAAFIIATGAAAMYERVVMFVTFWAIPFFKDPNKKINKNIISKAFEMMLPKHTKGLKLSKMNMFGIGPIMINYLIKKHNVKTLSDLIKIAGEMGVEIYLCEMSMNLMGYKWDEIIYYPKIKPAGVAKFVAEAGTSKATIFI